MPVRAVDSMGGGLHIAGVGVLMSVGWMDIWLGLVNVQYD